MQIFLLAAALTLNVAQVQPDIPNRQPQIAASARVVDLVFGSGNSIWITRSTNNGATFATPLQVMAVPAMALGRHRGPRVVRSGEALLVSAIYGSTVSSSPHAHGLPENGDLVTWRSTDNGITWSKPVVINDVPGSAREGLHSIAAGPNGEVAAVWLDLRAKGTRLYGAYSHDRGTSWSKNVLIYESSEDTLCQCCHPSIVPAAKGEFVVMFRNLVNGSRDMYKLEWNLQTGAAKPEKIGSGSWVINACPMDGGGIASDGKETVSAWRRNETVYLADGRRPEQAIGQGKNVALALTTNGPYVAWTGTSGIQLKRPASAKSIEIARGGDFATLTALPNNHVVLGWEENGAIKVQVLE